MSGAMTPGFNHLSSLGGAKGRALAGEPIVVRNPDAVRPWQHVLEPLAGYLWLGASMLREGRRFEGAWNFGPTDQAGDHSVRWVVERFLGEWGTGSWVTAGTKGPKPHEAHRLSLDSAKARAQLGWAPAWDAQTAVRRTASWYREYNRAPGAGRDLRADRVRLPFECASQRFQAAKPRAATLHPSLGPERYGVQGHRISSAARVSVHRKDHHAEG